MQQDINTNIGDFLRFIRRGLLLSLLVAVTAGVAAFIASSRLEPQYQARATLNASRNTTDFAPRAGTPPIASPLDVKAYRVAINGNPVLEATLRSLGVDNPNERLVQDFKDRVRVTTDSTGTWNELGSLIHIDVTDNSPTGARDATNALVSALIAWDRDRARLRYVENAAILQGQIEEVEKQIREMQSAGGDPLEIEQLIARRNDLRSDLLNIRSIMNVTGSLLTVLQPATSPPDPIAPRPVFNTMLAFLLGFFLSYGVLLLRESLDTRLRDIDDLAKVSDHPVLASFPKLPNDSRRLPYEATSYLRTNLLFAMAEAQPKVLLVTSSNESEGKSSVALSLAESFVRNNYRTLLVDADMRRPTIAAEYRLNPQNHTSLETWLRNPMGPNTTTSVPINGRFNLHIVPSFQATVQAPELLSAGFRDCLDIWRKEYDVIVIDSAPILAVADTLTIAPLATGTLLVANQQKTDRRSVRATVDLLKRIGVRIPGVVATHVNREARQGSQYGYGYGYGLSGSERDSDVRTTSIPEPVTATKLSRTKRS